MHCLNFYIQCKRARKDVISSKAKETCKATNNGNFTTHSEEKPDAQHPRESQQVKTVTSARTFTAVIFKLKDSLFRQYTVYFQWPD